MSKSNSHATHYTSCGTRKYQANGPTEWGAIFKSIAEKIAGKGAPEGVGIRAALAYAVRNPDAFAAGGVKVGQTIEATLSAVRSAVHTPKATSPKTPKTPKAKTPKTPKAKTPKTPKAKTPKAPEVSA